MRSHRIIFLFLNLLVFNALAQENFNIEKDLNTQWLTYEEGTYKSLEGEQPTTGNAVYFKVDANQFPGQYIKVSSTRPFFIFLNGMVLREAPTTCLLNLDSLSTTKGTSSFLFTIYQQNINPRDLKTLILSQKQHPAASGITLRPSTYFTDFVIVAGLMIILLFITITRLNPKLAADYFSVIRIFSLREGEDAQSNARLTSSTNVQFYIICSLLLGFYLIIILYHLPGEYALPLHFQGHSFGAVVWQWIRLSTMILAVFFIKIILIFSLTRLFGLRGLARIHFFNWMRLLLIVIGASTIVLFIYFISRGQSADFFIVFLVLITITLTAWIFIVFLKLNGKSEHSMFHLFSYICATEIIPLLITVKVLFQ